MNILAIDTTTKKANVSTYINNIKTVKNIDNEITHSEKLLPLIDSILKETNCNIKDIDIFACTTGPGSFTGIRIGLATIKALAKVTNSKIFAINSLELLALSKKDTQYKIIVPLINARNSRAYFGIYNSSNQVGQLGNKYIKEIISDVIEYCTKENLNINNDVLFVLDNIELADYLCNQTKFNYIIQEIDMSLLIDLSLNTSNYLNYSQLDATYVRSSEAERTKYGE